MPLVRDTLLGFLATLLLLGGNVGAAFEDPETDDNVRVTVAVVDSLLRPGGTGTLTITFAPAEDIHINADPAVEVTISPAGIFRLRGGILQSTDETSGYLSLREPVRQKFQLQEAAKPGRHRLRGRLTYFYCSESGGWCRKQVVPFEGTVRVVR